MISPSLFASSSLYTSILDNAYSNSIPSANASSGSSNTSFGSNINSLNNSPTAVTFFANIN